MKFRNAWYSRRRSQVVAAAALLAATAVHAATPGRLTLSAYTDAAAGDAVMAGNYAAAIGKLAPHGMSFARDAVAASTNLCVAYIATRQLEQARAACDEAVDRARLDTIGLRPMERLKGSDALALAESNREVLSKLQALMLAKLVR